MGQCRAKQLPWPEAGLRGEEGWCLTVTPVADPIPILPPPRAILGDH